MTAPTAQSLQDPQTKYPKPPYEKQTQPWPGLAGGATMEKLEKFGGMTPMGRAGQSAELASIRVQLAASGASYATGRVYRASGGAGQP